jgi:RNA polymerase sigma-70 factor (ECF subfamily)
MSELEILEGCKQGDHRSQKLFYLRYKDLIQSISLRFVRNKYIADDIVQEVMISVFNGLKDFRGEAELKSWLFAVTRNKAMNHFNLENRESTNHITIEDYLPLEKGKYDFETRFVASDELTKAINLLQKQSPTGYMHFRLRAIEGMTYKEIADDIGVPEGTSKASYSRACEKLRRNIQLLNKIN